MVQHLAILDDYQDVATRYADWSALPGHPEVTVFTEPLGAGAVAALQPFDVIVAMRERTRFDAETLRALPKLRLLVTTGPANAAIDLAAAEAAGIAVAATAAGGTASTVELTWALILATARQLPTEDQNVRRGGWQQTIGLELTGSRLGLVGLGAIGSAVARVGAAFGMDVAAWSENLTPARAAEVGVTAVPKEELFRTADVVSVHLKLSERSVGTIGADDLARMKPSAILVNTSRGPLVDEAALLAALQDGRIAGAGLDVFATEPLPTDSPWRTAPRTVLTPHLGFVTDATYRRWYAEVVEDIAAWSAGTPLRLLTGPGSSA